MRVITCEELVNMETTALIGRLAACELSVLKTLGANKLRIEMRLVGWACQFIVWLIYLGKKETSRLKRRTASLVEFFFPVRVRKDDFCPSDGSAMVVYFNHQSLFEVLAAIWYCMRNFPEKRCVFPVNLPWYEALCPVIHELRELGVWITPMITPSTYRRLRKITGDDTEELRVVDRLKLRFEDEYGKMVVEFIQSKDVVAVAPSATRTRHIFPSRDAYLGRDMESVKNMPRTMTAIVFSLRRKSVEDAPVDFVPFVATREKRAGTGLNIWRRHDVYVGAAENLEVMLAKMRARTLDFDCYRRLAEYVPDEVKYNHSA